MSDLVLICGPDATIPADVAARAAEEGRRVLRSRFAKPGYLYECDLESMSPVPDEWHEGAA